MVPRLQLLGWPSLSLPCCHMPSQLRDLFVTRCLGPTPEVLHSVDIAWMLSTQISDGSWDLDPYHLCDFEKMS